MAYSDPPPPLLLTKRLSAFLKAKQNPQLPTLLLTTPQGKIVAYASPRPVAILRTHATVAASLVAIHTSSSVEVSSAIPSSGNSDLSSNPPTPGADDGDDNSGNEDDDTPKSHEESSSKKSNARKKAAPLIPPAIITVQLSDGTVVIRRLKCGLLLVCVGPSVQNPQHDAKSDQKDAKSIQQDTQSDQQDARSIQQDKNVVAQDEQLDNSDENASDDPTGSPSAASAVSVRSAESQTTRKSVDSAGPITIIAMRRRAADLAYWLDEKLATLKVPEDDFGKGKHAVPPPKAVS
ncbi:hypothetical protein E4U31_007597 [Claviceps sp. LM219 group G6]|nr:hypothetical protein E4U31_007597 [Claviceps sp. LM219 group G6]